MVLDAEGRERGLVEAREDQLLLARVGVDVPDGEDAGLAGRELLGVDLQRLLLEGESPVRDRPQLGVQPEAGEHQLAADVHRRLVRAQDRRSREPAVLRGQRLDRALVKNQLSLSGQRLHARNRSRLRAELRAPMHEGDAPRLAAEFERPVERAVAATGDEDVAAVEVLGAPHAVEQRAALVPLRVRHQEAARLERAEASRDDDAAGVESRAGGRLDVEAARGLALDGRDLLAEVEPGVEGPDLLEQAVDQLLRTAHGQRRDVVDRLVGIELRALSAGVRERIDDLALHAEQAELENGEETHGTRADDHAFGLDGRGGHGFVHVLFRWSSGRQRGEGGNSNR